MLYERWHSIARLDGNRVAVFDVANRREWTFAELADAAENTLPAAGDVQFPSGHTVQFVIHVLAAWRTKQPVLPLELGQTAPLIPKLPPATAHLKITSGTTGQPQLIAFTGEQLSADADNIVSTMRLSPALPNLGVISLAHSYGFSNLVTPLLLHGIPLILCPTPLPEMVRNAATGHASIALPAVPAMWHAWHQADSIPANVGIAISAGAPLPLELERAVFEKSQLKIHNFCGSTECGGIAYDRSGAPRTDPMLIGQPMDNVTLAVNDEGCLVVESAAVGQGYLASASDRLGNGRFVTNDLAELSNGELRIVGRASDIINIAGRKLSPETVETIIQAQPGVNNCVAFGVSAQDRTRFEEIVVAIELKPGAELAAVKRGVGTGLASWQIPRHWWVVDRIETNARGKISRSHWRARFLDAYSRTRPLSP
jgi:long-chain acyl-CoA synthetase